MSIPKHILVIRFSAMGDVAMTVPVLRALSEQYPDLKITVLTRSFFKPFFQNFSNVVVYEAELKGKHKGLIGLYRLSKELKSLNFDAIADLHNVLRTKVLKRLLYANSVVQLDKGRAEKKALVSGQIFKQLKTTHQRYANVFKALGYDLQLSNPVLPEPERLKKELSGFISDKSRKTIGVAPFAAHKGKMYPLDKMEQVIKSLSIHYNIILFGGGDKEIRVLDQFEAKYDAVRSAAGKLSLDEELNLISNLDLMLAMDSGNAHMAAMLGIKVLTIWGVTHPYAGFAPFHQPEDYTLTADRNQYPLIPTSVYGNKYPDDYENAAGSISVETIVEKVRSVANG